MGNDQAKTLDAISRKFVHSLLKWVHKCAPIWYTSAMAKKNVAFKTRVEEDLRREFIETCQAEDLSAAQVVRKFMRKYVDTHKNALQGSLFSDETYKDSGVR